MKYTFWTASVAILIGLTACSGALSPRAVRRQIATLGGSTLIPSEIEIERIISDTGGRAIAETSVKIAFQFQKEASGEWRIVSARLGDRQWIDINLLIKSLEQQYTEKTLTTLETLAAEIESYRRFKGTLPGPDELAHLERSMQPISAQNLTNRDAWGREIHYQPHRDGAFILTSDGPDGETGSPDDIVLTRQGR